MLTTSGRRIIDQTLKNLIKHNTSTPKVLEELVEDLHAHPILVPYQLINHNKFDDLVMGILTIMDDHTPQLPRVAGHAAYVIGSILETDVGRNKIHHIFSDKEHYTELTKVTTNLAAIIEAGDREAQINASGTMSVLVYGNTGRDWTLRQSSLDWVLHVLARNLLSDNTWMAANCALTLARLSESEEGRARILNHSSCQFIASQLIKSLGVDREGRGLNAAFAIAYLCDISAGVKMFLNLSESSLMISLLVDMLCSDDAGCQKNAAFAFKSIVSQPFGKERILEDANIDRILLTLSELLKCDDEEIATFSAVALRHLADRTEGYLRERDHPLVRPTLRHVLSQPSLSRNYRREAHKTLEALLLPAPRPPNLKVLDAHTILVSWDDVESKSGAEIIYDLYLGEQMIYTGFETNFTVNGLEEKTWYPFQLRAWTEEDEESPLSETVYAETFRAVSSPPRNLRAETVTASQIKIVWEEPERVYGVLKGYHVNDSDQAIRYEPVTLYHVASNLHPDTEYSFEVFAVTARGRGQKAVLSVRTLTKANYAPSKPDLIVVGAHEILARWDAPLAPIGRINGYEVLANGERVYYGMDRNCLANMLHPNTLYTFTVVAWTNDGRCESEPASKRTPMTGRGPVNKPWKTKEELIEWLDKQGLYQRSRDGLKSSISSKQLQNV